jgi:hypothetical protein
LGGTLVPFCFVIANAFLRCDTDMDANTKPKTSRRERVLRGELAPKKMPVMSPSTSSYLRP